MEQKPISILTRGAENGALMGGMFVLIFACGVLSTYDFVPASLRGLLSIIDLALIVIVPLLSYRMLRRSAIAAEGKLTLSALWLEGIISFICGGLIMAIATLVFFRWLQPDYIITNINMAIDIYRRVPEGQQMADMLQGMIDHHLIPQPKDIAMGMFWLVAFSGSVVTFILAAIVRNRHCNKSL